MKLFVNERMDRLELLVDNLQEMSCLAQAISTVIGDNMVVYLQGDLGAGKTSLVRLILQSMGYHNKVKSPSYTLVESYVISRLYLYHFDFYRFTIPEEFLESGLEDYFTKKAIRFIEWPQNAFPYLAVDDWVLQINNLGGEAREIWVSGHSEDGQKKLAKLRSELLG